MKNPEFTETAVYPSLPDIDHFLRKYSDQIDHIDQRTIYQTAWELVRWYRQSEPAKDASQVKRMLTADAKNIMLMETNLGPIMRREIATVFDALAVNGGQSRWRFPTDKHGHLVVKINQCYI